MESLDAGKVAIIIGFSLLFGLSITARVRRKRMKVARRELRAIPGDSVGLPVAGELTEPEARAPSGTRFTEPPRL